MRNRGSWLLPAYHRCRATQAPRSSVNRTLHLHPAGGRSKRGGRARRGGVVRGADRPSSITEYTCGRTASTGMPAPALLSKTERMAPASAWHVAQRQELSEEREELHVFERKGRRHTVA